MIDLLISLLLALGNIGAFAILAVGIVMIYRASRVLNLAHGAMVMFPAYVVFILNSGGASLAKGLLVAIVPASAVGPLVAGALAKRAARAARFGAGLAASVVTVGLLLWASRHGLPLPAAFVVGLASGGALGYLVERVFIRALRAQGPTAQTVGTVAAFGLVVAVSAKVFETGTQRAPAIFPTGGIDVAGSFIRWGEIGLFATALVLTAGLVALLGRTDLGLIMRGTAENRRAASLMSVDPDRITALTWVLGGTLAGLSGILLAGITNLEPYVLSLQALPAFVAALLGGLGSVLGALVGAGAVGAVFSVVPGIGPLKGIQGGAQLFLAIAAVGAMVARGARMTGGDVRAESVTVAGRRQPPSGLGPLAAARRPLALLGIAAAIALPLLPFVPSSVVGNLNSAARYAMIATSLVVLIGWVGQISLGHAALVGIGAYSTGWLTGALGIPFPLNLPLAGAVAAATAAVLGVVAVRVRGLFLAVATLIFSWMGSEFLFRQQWFTSHFRIDATPIGKAGAFPFFDFRDARTMYYVGWALTALAILAAANMRDSKTGRAMFAVQGSEMAAASLGINVTRYKVMAFAFSGFLAGVAGNMLMADARVVGPDAFAFNKSLLLVAIAVVGGLRSLGGAVAAGVVFGMLDELFYRVGALSGFLEVFSAGLLALVLLAYPGGLGALGSRIGHLLGSARRVLAALGRLDRGIDTLLADVRWARLRFAQRLRERLEAPAIEELVALGVVGMPAVQSAAPVSRGAQVPGGAGPAARGERPAPSLLPENRADRRSIVRAEGLTVRFGGLTAVSEVALEVREGEIVGLIGPNGAGKTVTFNSIAGIVQPSEGRVVLGETDVTNVPAHERARLGIARTFQALQLFPQLSVFDNLLVATHLHNPTGLASHVLATPRSLDAEREGRRRVADVTGRLGLEGYAAKRPGDLPFGALRMVEVARAVVTGLPFMMLDEAASGLDDTETERLVQLIREIRDMGVAILLIEHDVKMVMSVSDYVYVLDRGCLIAEGPPATVQRDPAVVAAYLGKAASEEEGVA
ncbi:MAG: ATP-binding cassette domain-containing protein [Acidobacteria bacterium]|nr:ATP-binding cassette domain-containing protein [Acidobacteriota bacterium]